MMIVEAAFSVDLSATANASLSFKIHYDIEDNFDYGRVLVNGQPIAGSITTTYDPNKIGFEIGFTGLSNGWTDASFDLSAFSGQQIELINKQGRTLSNPYFVGKTTLTLFDLRQVA